MNRITWRGLQLLILIAMAPMPALAQSDQPTARAPRREFEGPIAVSDVKPHIEHLASKELRGRSHAEGRKAGEYVRKHFEAAGLKPLFGDGQSFFQEIPARNPQTQERYIAGRNVGGVIHGTDAELRNEYIILSAHYDHLGVRGGKIYRGADDNASGVSMLLSVAKHFHNTKHQPKRSIVFLGFDMEEKMLWGSRWFVAHPPWPIGNVKFFLTADMIGRSLGNLPLPTVFVMGSEHSPLVKLALDDVGSPKGLEAARLGIDLIGPVPRSDYGPFRAKKIPFLFFSTGEHPDYHTPNDLPERIDHEKVARISSLIARLSKQLGSQSEAPVWTDELKPHIDEAKALNKICSLLMKANDDEEYKLTDLQKVVISQAVLKTKRIITRGKMSANERKELISVAQVLLLSVF
ncbi:MAG: aminopeptidase [Planctomycetaceae bacterium]|nr:aminopeptidase [Planctomycetaceae bacterium]